MGGVSLGDTASWQPAPLVRWDPRSHIVPDWDAVVCFSSLDDLLQYYADYPPMLDATSHHFLSGVKSQMCVYAWRNMLMGGDDRLYGEGFDPDILYVLNGIINGFKVVDPGAEIPSYHCENYSSSTHICIDLRQKLAEGGQVFVGG